jgi:hypothetical protein
MAGNANRPLSPNQQAMLDLALACDLKVSEPDLHPAMLTRHKSIQSQQDAADYLREVENKVHSRRRFKSAPKTSAIVSPAAKAAPKGITLHGTQASWAILLLVIGMVAAGWFAPGGANFILVMLLLLFMMLVLGLATTNRALGILIEDRNLMSLSRFQTVVWVILILGAYLTFSMVRIKMMAGGQPITDPLNIQIDPHLWALLGISTTSLVASPLILSTKRNQDPTPSATQKAAQMLDEPEPEVNANKQGTLYANSKLSDARLTDMFEGDELINTARIDLAKVQMFYFTIIAAICFVVTVYKTLTANNPDLTHLPLLPDGFVAVLGISHAGYLTSKGINRTPSQP